MPTNQPKNETVMNRPIFDLTSGTPTARALSGFPPTAKIQFPVRVRCSTQAANATNRTHQITVPQMVTGPTLKFDEKIACREPKPSILLMSGLDTDPVTSLVTPRLA